MSRITAASELSRDELKDAPEGEWIDTLLEKDNQLGRQVVANINQNLPILNSPMSQMVSLNLVHGASVTVKNPLSVPIRSVMAVACIGLSVDSTGKPTRGTYNLAMPQIEWHNSSKADGSVVVTPYFPGPVSGTGADGETLNINRSFASPASLTTSTTANVATTTSLTLTPGDWDVRGGVNFTTAAGTSVSAAYAAVSKTSATLPGTGVIANPAAGEIWMADSKATNVWGAAAITTVAIPSYRASVTTSTALFLVANASFTVSTLTCNGFLEARRVLPYTTGITGKVTLFFAGGE